MSWLGLGLRLGNEEYGAAVNHLIKLETSHGAATAKRYQDKDMMMKLRACKAIKHTEPVAQCPDESRNRRTACKLSCEMQATIGGCHAGLSRA
jgi:recombinational DNA repair protein RecR